MSRIVNLNVPLFHPRLNKIIFPKCSVMLSEKLYCEIYGNSQTYAYDDKMEWNIEDEKDDHFSFLNKDEKSQHIQVIRKFNDDIIKLCKTISPNRLYLKYVDENSIVKYLNDNKILNEVLCDINKILPLNIHVCYIHDLSMVYVMRYSHDFDKTYMKKSIGLSIQIVIFIENILEWIEYCMSNKLKFEEQNKYFNDNIDKYRLSFFRSNAKAKSYWYNHKLISPMELLLDILNKDRNIYFKYDTTNSIFHVKHGNYEN